MEGRFRYSDLKEAARRGSLWVLYVVERVLMICKVGVGGDADRSFLFDGGSRKSRHGHQPHRCFAQRVERLRSSKADQYSEVLVLYLKRPQATR